MSSIDERFLVNTKDTAKIMGVSVQALDKWEIKPHKKEGREVFYYVPDVVQYRIQRGDAKNADDLTAARTRHANRQADKIEFDLSIQRREVVPVSEAVGLLEKLIEACRARLLAIPTKAAPLLQGKDTLPEKREVLTQVIDEALHELAAIDPSGLGNGGGAATVETASEDDGKPVGGKGKTPKPRGKRRTRKVE